MSIFMLFIISLTIIQASSQDSSTYRTTYDENNLDEILMNNRLMVGYVNCLMEVGRCTPDAKELKDNIVDAIENGCKKCTDKQREAADKVMQYMIDNRSDDWTKLEKKYNPDGSYKKQYLASKNKLKTDSKNTKISKETQ